MDRERQRRLPRPELLLLDASVQLDSPVDGVRRQLDEFVTRGFVDLLRHDALRYGDVRIRTHDIELMRKPFNKALLMRLLATGRCRFEDEQGRREALTTTDLLRLAYRRLKATWRSARARRRLGPVIDGLERAGPFAKRRGPGAPLYLRTDLVFGLRSGGSVTHIAGVVNELAKRPGGVRIVSTDRIPTVADAADWTIVKPDASLRDVPEANALLMNLPTLDRLGALFDDAAPRFVYQRYSVHNLVGVLAAERWDVPLVIEYNGSEVWVSRNWGRALRDEATARRIEDLNLARADLVVVVSEVLADEITARGVSRDRILVNPNGVDTDVYRPDRPAANVKGRLALDGKTVIGFIGTFGPWHGAEVLVDAFALLVDEHPALRDRVRLMMVGDGQEMPAVQRAIKRGDVDELVALPGRVAQQAGPDYLAACDILVSPHVPNPDGSEFFGSPTKLFEYMAMGRPIVASRLAQIGEVLDDGETALLVPPGDPQAIAAAIFCLLDQPALAQRLGDKARATAVRRHTWRDHTRRILDRLEQLVGDDVT
ncbi:MAG: glycosyltransferase [Gammaproteobacteria bacterium]|nr:glycosyltransferase [Gammaproteobacteria bacterium]